MAVALILVAPAGLGLLSTTMTETTAALMVQMLKNVVNEGTAIRLRDKYQLLNDIGGKTGTTQSNADGWFIAMTPRLVTGVWVGGSYPAIHFRSTALGQGANTALPVYALYQQQINSDRQFYPMANDRFPVAPEAVASQLACDPFRDDVNFWQSLFGKEKKADKPEKTEETSPDEKDKGFFNGIKKLFKKKE